MKALEKAEQVQNKSKPEGFWSYFFGGSRSGGSNG